MISTATSAGAGEEIDLSCVSVAELVVLTLFL